MTFQQATDRIAEGGVSLVTVAGAFGVTPNTVSRWRSGRGRNALKPPADWPETLADLARRHCHRRQSEAATLASLADSLDPPA